MYFFIITLRKTTTFHGNEIDTFKDQSLTVKTICSQKHCFHSYEI